MRGNTKIFVTILVLTTVSMVFSSVPLALSSIKCSAQKKSCCSKENTTACSHTQSMKSACCCYNPQAQVENVVVINYEKPQPGFTIKLPSTAVYVHPSVSSSNVFSSQNSTLKDRCVLNCVFRI